MHLRLLKTEIFRMVCNPGFPIVVLVVVGLVTFTLFSQRPDPLYDDSRSTVQIGLFGAFGMEAPILYVFAAPAIAGFVASGSLAADLRRGYPDLLRMRGISRTGYVTTKASAMFFATLLGTFASFLASVALAALYLPVRPTTSKIPVEPFPNLFASSPAIYDLTVAILLSVGAAALALSGLIVGAIFANEYAAAACPFVLTVGLSLFAGAARPLRLVQPEFYLNLREGYGMLSLQWQSFAAPLYWAIFSLVCLGLGTHLYRRRDR